VALVFNRYKQSTIKLKYNPTRRNKRLVRLSAIENMVFKPPIYLSSGHLQTFVQGFYELGFNSDESNWGIQYAREFVNLDDGGQLALDWSYPEEFTKDSDMISHPILCLVPGLTGASGDVYILNTIAQAHDLGYICVVINHRGAPGTYLNTPKLYNAASSDDLNQALNFIRASRSEQVLYAVGFSLGANLLTKYLGEVGESAVVSGACVISNPWNFHKCYQKFSKDMFGFYDSILIDLYKKKHEDHIELLEENSIANYKDVLEHAKTFAQFDIMVTCKVYGYSSLEEYYTKSSSSEVVENIKIPVFALNSLDDPVSVSSAIPFDKFGKNEHVIFGYTKSGGHVGWYDKYACVH